MKSFHHIRRQHFQWEICKFRFTFGFSIINSFLYGLHKLFTERVKIGWSTFFVNTSLFLVIKYVNKSVSILSNDLLKIKKLEIPLENVVQF